MMKRAPLFLALMLAACQSATAAGPVTGSEPKERPLAGGWSEREVDERVKATAAAAVQLLAGADWLARPVELVSVESARTQVVAGLNSELSLKVRLDGKERALQLRVYTDLQQVHHLAWMRLEAPEAQ